MDKTTLILIGVGAVILLLCFLLSIASFSGDRFYETYKKLLKASTQTPFTASMFISALNRKYLQNKVQIMPISREAGDYYNSRQKLVALYLKKENSLASFAVIAHEMGHAYQDIVEGKLQSFNNLRRAGVIIGKLFLPVLLIGVVSLFLVENYLLVIGVTVAVLAFIILLAIIIKAKTISVEKDASDIGLGFLREILPEEEVKRCKKLLDSARLTYWADLIKLLLSWSGLTSKTEMFK